MASSDVDISQLTEEQQLALQQYTSVTNQDLSAAVSLLQRCQWNVQIAISRFFDGEPTNALEVPQEDLVIPPPQTLRQHDTLANGFTSPYSTTASHRQNHSPAPRVVATPSNHLNHQAPFILSLLLTPVNFVYALVARTFSFISRLFPFLPRLLSRLAARTPHTRSVFSSSNRRPLGPQDTTSRFLREFEEEYGQHELPFVDTSYARAFDLAKQDLKFLLVIPLSPEHDATAPFVRNILLSPVVASFLSNASSNTILWSGTISDSETYQVATALQLTTFPSCALIAHAPSVSSTAMSVLLRLQPGTNNLNGTRAFTSPENFIAAIQACITQNSAALNRARSQRAEQQASRDIREQQNTAYERSLAQDRERARQRREAEAARQREEEEEMQRRAQEEKAELERRDNEERYAQNMSQWKRWRAKSIQPEPEAADKGTVRVSVRLPNGERVMRRFAADAEIEELYAFVECYDYLNDNADDEKEVVAPRGFKHSYRFQLVSPMPREVYALEHGGTVRERIGRSGNLIVERIEEDDDTAESGLKEG